MEETIVPKAMLRDLSSLFSADTLVQIANNRLESNVSSLLKECKLHETVHYNDSIWNVFDKLYTEMESRYPCEYLYKDSIVAELVSQRHTVNNAVFSEFRIANSKADVVVVNGTSWSYEIKTELDTTSRLNSQLKDYLFVIDKVNVLTHEKLAATIERCTPQSVGVLIRNTDGGIRTVRKALSNKKEIIPSQVFCSLRKSEYTKIIRRQFGYVPEVPNTLDFLECQRLFALLDPDVAHDEMCIALKDRWAKNIFREYILAIPRSFRVHFMCANLPTKVSKILVSLITNPQPLSTFL